LLIAAEDSHAEFPGLSLNCPRFRGDSAAWISRDLGLVWPSRQYHLVAGAVGSSAQTPASTCWIACTGWALIRPA